MSMEGNGFRSRQDAEYLTEMMLITTQLIAQDHAEVHTANDEQHKKKGRSEIFRSCRAGRAWGAAADPS